jgi:hypothetical protein
MPLSFKPPWFLRSGLAMTLYTALGAQRQGFQQLALGEPPYQSQVLFGADGVPLFTWLARPAQPKGTLIATYGITGDLENQWFLRLLGQQAYQQGYAVLLFDWRGHGKTAELSPTLTSDGLYEGEDFVHLAAQAKTLGCPAPFWFAGYSLGGQLALWGIYKAQSVQDWGPQLAIQSEEIAGGVALCPSLESERSLRYLMAHPIGRFLEQRITQSLKQLAHQLYQHHPQAFDPAAIERANSIWSFDQELVIGRLGFASVPDYYQASSALSLLAQLQKPTLILYAADDPLFDPTLIPELQAMAQGHPALDLALTQYGGHVGYFSSRQCQAEWGDPDPWWAIHRMLHWLQAGPPAVLASRPNLGLIPSPG